MSDTFHPRELDTVQELNAMNASTQAAPPPEGIREVAARLRAVQKPPRGASAYTRYVNRRLGRYLAAIAYRLRLTPNQVTFLSFALSVLSLAVIAFGQTAVVSVFIAVAGLLLAFGLDSADGQLARLSGGGSALGEFLDHSFDTAKIYLFHGAVAVVLMRSAAVPDWAPLIAFSFQFIAIVVFSSSLLVGFLRPKPSAGSDTAHVTTMRALALAPLDYGVLCLSLLLLPWPVAFLPTYIALMLLTAVFAVMVFSRWGGELSVG